MAVSLRNSHHLYGHLFPINDVAVKVLILISKSKILAILDMPERSCEGLFLSEMVEFLNNEKNNFSLFHNSCLIICCSYVKINGRVSPSQLLSQISKELVYYSIHFGVQINITYK